MKRRTYEETFENSQRLRDEHWSEGGGALFGTHRINCSYCYKRMRGLELPTIKLKLIDPHADRFEIREVFDDYDPRFKLFTK
jgi:hypothetical protein